MKTLKQKKNYSLNQNKRRIKKENNPSTSLSSGGEIPYRYFSRLGLIRMIHFFTFLFSGIHIIDAQTYGSGNLGNASCNMAGTGGACTDLYIGSAAGVSNTATNCSFIGDHSGFSNTTGTQNTSLGTSSLYNNTTAGENIAIGYQSLYTQSYNPNSAWSSYNIAIGNGALYSNQPTSTTTGIGNIGIGYQSGNNNQTGTYCTIVGVLAGNGVVGMSHSNNSFYGAYSGYGITSGGSNCFLGDYSGYTNTTGANNIFIGHQAGYYNQTGGSNAVLGYQAGGYGAGAANSYNTNSIFGYQSGYSTQTGSNNVYIGYQAGYSNATSGANVFAGYKAGYNNTGSSNSFYGQTSGNGNTSGANNVAMGLSSGYYNQTGSDNTCIGYGAGFGSSGNSYNYNSFLGFKAGYSTTGNNNTAVGYQAGYTNTSGTNNTFVGYGADANAGTYTNSSAFGNGATITASNQIYLGNSNVTSVASAVGSWSDGRFKFNVQENVKGLDFILKLRPVTYQFDTKKFEQWQVKDAPDSIKTLHMTAVGDCNVGTSRIHSGFIAQEVEKAAKQSGYFSSIVNAPADSGKAAYSLSYSEIVVPLVKAVQELSKQLDSLKKGKQAQRTMQNGNDEQGKNTIDIKLALPGAIMLGEAQPNPNNGSAQVPYFVPENTTSKVVFTDMLGRTMKEETLKPGYGMLNIDTQDLPAGIYNYTLIADGKVMDTKRMIRK